jgi:hypothetical protein
MKIVGWVLVLIGACLLAWGGLAVIGKGPGAGDGWLPITILGAVVFVLGWAGIRFSRRR